MLDANLMDEDWSLLVSLLPPGWRELARSTGALKGLRKDKGVEEGLRVLLLHLACGYSLRETATRARATRLADLSDVAVLKRLRKSKEWLHALCRHLLLEQAPAGAASPAWALRLIDATHIQEPGPTGSAWRLHYSLRWPQLTCDHFQLTTTVGVGSGESLTHFPVRAGDHLLADRGYSNYRSVRHVQESGGWVTVRLNPAAVRLLSAEHQPFDLAGKLRRLPANRMGCWAVALSNATGQEPVPGRLCAVRKSRAAMAKARAQARRSSLKHGRQPQPETLFLAEYVLVFTTAPDTFSAQDILETYRLRWQIELVFKRFKQLAQLGHLPKEDDDSAQAWLYGKLFVALLTERLIQHAESFSPWGYDVAPKTPAESLAGV